MRLSDAHPSWATVGAASPSGLWFDCPGACCAGAEERGRLYVPFTPALDGTPLSGEPRWQRTGNTFGTLTLAPSVQAKGEHDWQGFIRSGHIVTSG